MEVELTDVGKQRLQDHYPQGWAAEFIELTYLGIPYRIPPDIDGQPTISKITKKGASLALERR